MYSVSFLAVSRNILCIQTESTGSKFGGALANEDVKLRAVLDNWSPSSELRARTGLSGGSI